MYWMYIVNMVQNSEDPVTLSEFLKVIFACFILHFSQPILGTCNICDRLEVLTKESIYNEKTKAEEDKNLRLRRDQCSSEQKKEDSGTYQSPAQPNETSSEH
jgi:hypothetical protein